MRHGAFAAAVLSLATYIWQRTHGDIGWRYFSSPRLFKIFVSAPPLPGLRRVKPCGRSSTHERSRYGAPGEGERRYPTSIQLWCRPLTPCAASVALKDNRDQDARALVQQSCPVIAARFVAWTSFPSTSTLSFFLLTRSNLHLTGGRALRGGGRRVPVGGTGGAGVRSVALPTGVLRRLVSQGPGDHRICTASWPCMQP